MYINRKIDKRIKSWESDDKKSLMIFGARQIGKTKSIRHFLTEHYHLEEDQDVPIFNLAGTDNEYRNLLLKSKNEGNALVEELFALQTNSFDYDVCDILFIDEIQELGGDDKENSSALLKGIIKRLISGKYRIIFSGSLLGAFLTKISQINIEINEIDVEKMYPITLEEFILNYKRDESSINQLKDVLANGHDIPKDLHVKFLKYFIEYSYIGGMPDSLVAYSKNNKVADSLEAIKNLMDTYYEDVRKYFKSVSETFEESEIFTILFKGLSEIDKKSFLKTNIKSENKRKFYNYVLDSDVGLLVPHVEEKEIGLSDQSKPKSYFNDVGFLRRVISSLPNDEIGDYYKQYDDRLKESYEFVEGRIKSPFSSFEGKIFEQIIAQELKANNTTFYYDLKKENGRIIYENEFVSENKTIILEIKSGSFEEQSSTIENKNETSVFMCSMLPFVAKYKEMYYVPVYCLAFVGLEEIVKLHFKEALPQSTIDVISSGRLPHKTYGFYDK